MRWVLHYHAPSTLSEYVQEVGRGGRDGKPAEALTLVSERTGWLDPQDKQRWQFFTQKSNQLQQEAKRLSHRLPSAGHIDDALKQDSKALVALALLHSNGQLIWQDPFHYRLMPGAKAAKSNFFGAVNEMKEYLFGKRCRWQTLMTQFGFGEEAQDMKCGHCDRCRA